MRSVKLFRIAVVVAALAALGLVARPYMHGLSFVVRVADMQGTARRIADFDAKTVADRAIAIPLSSGAMRGRVYEPSGRSHRTALLVSGLHVSGIDEPRLVRLARELAGNG